MENRIPLIGEKIPQMSVKTTHGMKNIPDDYKGKWLVLFSHPGDFTPVCTTEFYSFQDKADQFKAMDAELLGLSIDQVQSHIKWTEWINDNFKKKIEFPIIADDRGQVAERLGMIHPGKGNNTVRAVFIIDTQGIVRTILYYPQELGRNMDEIIRIIKGLQISDKNKVAVPANWPDNELMKDDVIIPPAADEKTAEERRGQDGCYDWWLCHKKL